MKTGDIVVCINGDAYENNLTEDKQYQVLNLKFYPHDYTGGGALYVKIRNDLGTISEYDAEKFKLLSEIREEKLKELGI